MLVEGVNDVGFNQFGIFGLVNNWTPSVKLYGAFIHFLGCFIRF